MAEMKISCPDCGMVLTVDSSMAGQSVMCLGCRKTFEVTAPAPPEAEPEREIEKDAPVRKDVPKITLKPAAKPANAVPKAVQVPPAAKPATVPPAAKAVTAPAPKPVETPEEQTEPRATRTRSAEFESDEVKSEVNIGRILQIFIWILAVPALFFIFNHEIQRPKIKKMRDKVECGRRISELNSKLAGTKRASISSMELRRMGRIECPTDDTPFGTVRVNDSIKVYCSRHHQ